MANKICSYTETVPFGTPAFAQPGDSGTWFTLGMYGARTYHSYNNEATTFDNVKDEHEFKIYDLTLEKDIAEIKTALVNFHDVHNKMVEIESRFMTSNYTALMKKIMDNDQDLREAITACEQEKTEYLQSLGFPGTEILDIAVNETE